MSHTSEMRPIAERRVLDPRVYQIGALATLLLYGMLALDFDVSAPRALLLLSAVIAAQYTCTRLWRLPRFDAKSALISGLSLCLLLRTNSPWLAAAAAALTIASKFVLRWNGKHVFNPTNFGIAGLLLATDRVWVSPGQWGSATIFAVFIGCAGLLVVLRAARSDVTIAFLVFYAGLVFGRSLWLGEPLAIPIHRLESGALLLFSFFMISDPKTTPDSRPGRILFALLVAFGAGFVQFRLFRTNGLIWSLAFFSLFVPIIDLLLPGRRYRWDSPDAGALPLIPKGAVDAAPVPLAAALPRPGVAREAGVPVLRLLRGAGGREAL